VINVPQAGMFFVEGAVRSPGAFPLRQSYTLTQAITIAGGLNQDLASPGDITIIRRGNSGEIQTIPVDLREIAAGSAADPKIEVEDQILVSMSTAKYIWRYYFLSVLGAVSRVGSLVTTGF